jgi:hypothetical protein
MSALPSEGSGLCTLNYNAVGTEKARGVRQRVKASNSTVKSQRPSDTIEVAFHSIHFAFMALAVRELKCSSRTV